MTLEGVRAGLASPEVMDARLARQGDARRILDRLIGHTFSRSGAPAGRILTPLLATLRRRAPIVGVVRLTAAAADGGPAWRVDVPFTAQERSVWEARIAEAAGWRGLGVESAELLAPQAAWTYTDMVRSLCGRPVPVETSRKALVREEAACA
jgi:DNA topoisomerase IA